MSREKASAVVTQWRCMLAKRTQELYKYLSNVAGIHFTVFDPEQAALAGCRRLFMWQALAHKLHAVELQSTATVFMPHSSLAVIATILQYSTTHADGVSCVAESRATVRMLNRRAGTYSVMSY
jgi:hypothetical protein